MTDYRLVIMGLCGLLCLCSIDGALASESEMLDLQIQLLDQEMMALRRHQAALSQSLALPREIVTGGCARRIACRASADGHAAVRASDRRTAAIDASALVAAGRPDGPHDTG